MQRDQLAGLGADGVIHHGVHVLVLALGVFQHDIVLLITVVHGGSGEAVQEVANLHGDGGRGSSGILGSQRIDLQMALDPALVKGIFHPDDTRGLGHHVPHLLGPLPEGVHIVAQQHHRGGVTGAAHFTHAGDGGGGGHGHIHARIVGKLGGVKLSRFLAAALAVVHGVGREGSGIVGDAEGHVFKVLVRQQDGFQLLNPFVHDRQLGTGPEGDVHGDAAVIVVGDEDELHLACQKDGGQKAANADQHYLAGTAQQLGHHMAVEVLELMEQAVYRNILLGLGGQEGEGQRHHHNGAEEGGQQGQDDGPQQGAEHHAGHALADGERDVHHHGGEGACQNGHEHGAGALGGGLLKGKALLPEAEAALQNDDGVIHDHADSQDQARAGEDVHIVADEVQHDDRQQDGQGHTDAHHQTALPVTEEQEQNRHGQHHAHQQGLENTLQGVGDIIGLVVDDLIADPLTGVAVQRVKNLAAHAHSGGAVLLGDGEEDAFTAIVAADAVSVLLVQPQELGDVTQSDELAGGGLDGELAHLGVHGEVALGAEGDVLRPHSHAAQRDLEVRRADGGSHRGDVQTVLLHLFLVQHHPEVIVPRAADLDLRHAADALKVGLDLVIQNAGDVHAAVRRHGERHGGHGVGADLHDGGVVAVGGEGGLQVVHGAFQVGVDVVLVSAVVVYQLHHGVVIVAVGHGAGNVGEGLALVGDGLCHQLIHAFGIGAGPCDDDQLHRHTEIRHEVQGHPRQGRTAEDDDRQQQHQHGDGPLQKAFDEFHAWASPS